MDKTETYTLEIHFYPKAALAEVKPVIYRHTDDEGPQFYQPVEIEFQHRPMREDLLAVIKQTPWMSTQHFTEFLQVLEVSQFPMVSQGMKANSQDLIVGGLKVGHISVHRRFVYCNERRHIPLCLDEIDKYVRRSRGDRVFLKALLLEHENSLKEIAVKETHGDITKAIKIFVKRDKKKWAA